MCSASKARDRRLRPGDRERIRAALAESGNPWAAAAFELAIETTLRQAMLFELRWDWIDLQARVIHIPSSYQEKANKGVPREIPISTRALAVLQGLARPIDGRAHGREALVDDARVVPGAVN